MIVLCHDTNEVGVCIVANELLKKWGRVSHVGSAEALGVFFEGKPRHFISAKPHDYAGKISFAEGGRRGTCSG